MARLNDVMMAYFVTGALMWATGFLEWSETGLVNFFLTIAGRDVSGSGTVTTNLTDMSGPISNVVNTLGGGLLAAWNVLVNLVGFTFWPITVLSQNGAPVEAIVLLGGPPVVAFVGGFITIVRGSA